MVCIGNASLQGWFSIQVCVIGSERVEFGELEK